MFNQISPVLEALAGILSALAAIAAAIAAWRSSAAATESARAATASAAAATESVTAANRSADAAEKAIDLAKIHQADRIRMVKGHHELEHMAKLIVTFAELRAIAVADPSPARDQELTAAIGSIEFQVRVLESLDEERGRQIGNWLEPERGRRLVTVARSVYGTRRRLGRRDREFLATKMTALHELQDCLFASMTGPHAPQPVAPGVAGGPG